MGGSVDVTGEGSPASADEVVKEIRAKGEMQLQTMTMWPCLKVEKTF